MKKLLFILSSLCSQAFAQDYKEGIQSKDGFTPVYRTISSPAQSSYYTPTSITNYGLINKNKELVLPLIYKAVMTTYEPGLYIVKDTLDMEGLYNAFTKKFITEQAFNGIDIFVSGLSVVNKSKEGGGLIWGAIDTKGTLVIPVDYDYLGTCQEGLINFRKDYKYGFIDKNNTVVIPNIYENPGDFYDGLAPAWEGGSNKYGYIDKQNKMLIPAIYDGAENFNDGYAVVKKGGSSGIINTKGKEFTDFSYSYISMRKPGGLFLVEKQKIFGLIDSTGKVVVPIAYKGIYSSANDGYQLLSSDKKYGLANSIGKIVLPAEYQSIGTNKNGNLLYLKKDDKFSIADKDLKTIVPADTAVSLTVGNKHIAFFYMDKAKIFDINGKLLKTVAQPNMRLMGGQLISNEDSISLSYNSAIFLVNLATKSTVTLPYNDAGDFNEEGVFIGKNDKYNFIDHTGKQLNATGYYAAVNFTDGVCAVQESSSASPYLADKNFTKIKALSTTFKGPYSEGLALSVGAFGVLSYLDKTGATAFTTNGKDGGKCTDGRIMIVDNYSNYWYVDKTGKQIGKDSWKGIREFSDGLSAVFKDGKWGFVDGAANYVITAKYDEASSFINGTAVVKSGGKYMLINKKGEPINNDVYEAAGDPGNGGFPLMKGGKVGLVDSKGAIVVDFKYSNITTMNEDRLWAKKNGNWALVDNKGKELSGFIYTSAGEFKNGYAYVAIGEKVGVVDKTGKLVLPTEYKSVGSVYKNTVVAMKGAGVVKYSIR